MFEGLDELVAVREEADRKLKAAGEGIVKGALKAFFAKWPNAIAVKWQGYTPHFNDGEPCVYGLHGVYLRLSDMPEDAGDLDDGFVESYDLKDSAIKSDFEKFCRGLDKLGDTLQAVFGDHAEVTASRTGITVEEYDHD